MSVCPRHLPGVRTQPVQLASLLASSSDDSWVAPGWSQISILRKYGVYMSQHKKRAQDLGKEINLKGLRCWSISSLPSVATSSINHRVFSQSFFHLEHRHCHHKIASRDPVRLLCWLTPWENIQPLQCSRWRGWCASPHCTSPPGCSSRRSSNSRCGFQPERAFATTAVDDGHHFCAVQSLAHFKDIVVANDHDGHCAARRLRWTLLCPVNDLGLLLC